MTAHAHFASTHPLTSPAQDPSQALAVWNAKLNRFSWVGANGIELLRKPASELSAALHKNTLRKLNAIASAPKAIKAAPLVLRLKGAVQVACTAEAWRLADGDLGVILYPGQTGEPGVQKQEIAVSSEDGSASAKRSIGQAPSSQQSFTPSQLTAEEWKSFKSIGRMVRKLCREKAGIKRVSHLPEEPSHRTSPPTAEPATVADFIPIFDVFLVLDADWRVMKCKGALGRLGWQSRGLRGQALSQLFDSREAALVAKCMRSVEANRKSVKKTALLAQQPNSGRVSCKVLFGPWTVDPAEYFVGLICLNVAKRFVPSEQPNGPEPQIFGMAA